MISPRRTRALAMGILLGFVFILYYSRHEKVAGSDFYSRTVSSLDNAQAGNGQAPIDPAKVGGMSNPRIDHDNDGSVDKDDDEVAQQVAERLYEAEQKAKGLANSKSPNKPDRPDKLIGVGNAAGYGHDEESQEEDGLADVDNALEKEEPESVKVDDSTKEEDPEVTDELDRILRRAPVIIFSKSYCPHSRKAKMILLEKYKIDPKPFVVELDEHPLGGKIQDHLFELTGRATVPNVLVNGKSLGGGSEMEELHRNNKLITSIQSLGSVGGGKSSKVTVKHAKS